jgi:hypothetical protein
MARLGRELQSPGLSVETACDRDVIEERCDRYPLAPLLIGGNSNVGQGAVDEVAQPREASPKHRPGTAVDGDRTPLESLIRQDRRIEQVTGLVSDVSRALGFFSGLDSAVMRACSVTASAIAVSRQPFSVLNSSVVIGAFCSMASSVTA